LSGRSAPARLPQAAREVLARLHCDLIDQEDVLEEWLTTLADAGNPGPVRSEIKSLRDQVLGQADSGQWKVTQAGPQAEARGCHARCIAAG
jgi:hypothetical protein